MPPDPARPAEARAWLDKATADLRAAEVLFNADPPLLAEAAYHCQQCAEKALNGFLSWQDIPFGKTHDLAVIGSQCVGADPSLESICIEAEHLSVFAWAFR